VSRRARILIVVAALVFAAILTVIYLDHREKHPSTNDAYVEADIVQIAAQVSGPIVNLAVSDNQRVEAGDLLFEIDPRPFRIAVDAARAQLDKTSQSVSGQVDSVASAEAGVERARASLRLAEVQFRRVEPLAKQGALPQQDRDKAQAQLDEARSGLTSAQAQLTRAQDELGQLGEKNASTRAAMANLENAKLQLEYTKVVAPVDGLVTQLQLGLGTFVRAGSPALALVNTDSWRVIAYMREDQLRYVAPGQPARIYLPAYPDTRFAGVVQGIGWGIQLKDGAVGSSGLPSVSPTVDWVRLAQRFPVRITLAPTGDTHPLRKGLSATVRIDRPKAVDSATETEP